MSEVETIELQNKFNFLVMQRERAANEAVDIVGKLAVVTHERDALKKELEELKSKEA